MEITIVPPEGFHLEPYQSYLSGRDTLLCWRILVAFVLDVEENGAELDHDAVAKALQETASIDLPAVYSRVYVNPEDSTGLSSFFANHKGNAHFPFFVEKFRFGVDDDYNKQFNQEDWKSSLSSPCNPKSPRFEAVCNRHVEAYLKKVNEKGFVLINDNMSNKKLMMKDEPMVVAQLTQFYESKSNKQLTNVLSVSVSHQMFDAYSLFQFIKRWSDRCHYQMESQLSKVTFNADRRLFVARNYRKGDKESTSLLKNGENETMDLISKLANSEEAINMYATNEIKMKLSPLDKESTENFNRDLEECGVPSLINEKGNLIEFTISQSDINMVKDHIVKSDKELASISSHQIIFSAFLQGVADTNSNGFLEYCIFSNLRNRALGFTTPKDFITIGNYISREKSSVHLCPNILDSDWIVNAAKVFNASCMKALSPHSTMKEFSLYEAIYQAGKIKECLSYRSSADMYESINCKLRYNGVTFNSWSGTPWFKCNFGKNLKVSFFGEYPYNGIHIYLGFPLVLPSNDEGDLKLLWMMDKEYDENIIRRLKQVFLNGSFYIYPRKEAFVSSMTQSNTHAYQNNQAEDDVESKAEKYFNDKKEENDQQKSKKMKE